MNSLEKAADAIKRWEKLHSNNPQGRNAAFDEREALSASHRVAVLEKTLVHEHKLAEGFPMDVQAHELVHMPHALDADQREQAVAYSVHCHAPRIHPLQQTVVDVLVHDDGERMPRVSGDVLQQTHNV